MAVKVIDPVFPSLLSFLYSFFYILLNLSSVLNIAEILVHWTLSNNRLSKVHVKKCLKLPHNSYYKTGWGFPILSFNFWHRFLSKHCKSRSVSYYLYPKNIYIPIDTPRYSHLTSVLLYYNKEYICNIHVYIWKQHLTHLHSRTSSPVIIHPPLLLRWGVAIRNPWFAKTIAQWIFFIKLYCYL